MLQDFLLKLLNLNKNAFQWDAYRPLVVAVSPAMHTPSPAMSCLCHACPPCQSPSPAMHAPLTMHTPTAMPHTPPCHAPPAMHASPVTHMPPCHTCTPLPCTPPGPHMPPAMHAPLGYIPLPHPVPLWTESQTPVKTLPCRKFCLRTVKHELYRIVMEVFILYRDSTQTQISMRGVLCKFIGGLCTLSR